MIETLNDLLRTYVLVTLTFTFGTWPFLLPIAVWQAYGPEIGLPLALAHLIGYPKGCRMLDAWRD